MLIKPLKGRGRATGPMSETRLVTTAGEFELHRYPARKRELLRAWDAADEYLLHEMPGWDINGRQILIVNDSFGALSVALSRSSPVSWSDSWLAHKALRENLKRNGRVADAVEALRSTQTPAQSPDLVIFKVPKSLALLEDQLLRVKPLLNDGTRFVVAGMVKTMPPSGPRPSWRPCNRSDRRVGGFRWPDRSRRWPRGPVRARGTGETCRRR